MLHYAFSRMRHASSRCCLRCPWCYLLSVNDLSESSGATSGGFFSTTCERRFTKLLNRSISSFGKLSVILDKSAHILRSCSRPASSALFLAAALSDAMAASLTCAAVSVHLVAGSSILCARERAGAPRGTSGDDIAFSPCSSSSTVSKPLSCRRAFSTLGGTGGSTAGGDVDDAASCPGPASIGAVDGTALGMCLGRSLVLLTAANAAFAAARAASAAADAPLKPGRRSWAFNAMLEGLLVVAALS
mmetsp:Transcript_16797/g.37670  ORF Transcript_16797/g.37670 Transcript_16797/m.37670 type:complete len:246 (-) Transcript_16797:2910-3647(-)